MLQNSWTDYPAVAFVEALSRMRAEEGTHRRSHLLNMGFQREVARIEELYLRVRIVPLVSLRSRRNEERIVFAPDGQQRRLCLAEILLKRGIKLYIVGVIQKQVELNIHIAGPRINPVIQRVALGRIRSG
jgi:hypothetical protein